MANHWLNQDQEETTTLTLNNHVTFQGMLVNQAPGINFYMYEKEVMRIDANGKIHVDPDAPADETAAAVCRILSSTFSLQSQPDAAYYEAARKIEEYQSKIEQSERNWTAKCEECDRLIDECCRLTELLKNSKNLSAN